MKRQHRIAGIVSTILMAVSFFSQPLLGQQSNSQPPAQQPPETAQQPQQSNPPAQPNTAPASTTAPSAQNQQGQPQQQAPGSTTVNPSQAPLQPVTTYPNASDTQQQPEQPGAATAPAQATTIPEAPQPKKPAEPVGAAAAESVPTAGGAAAKPAGVAIAPAKQHQTRSLLIKVGAALAAGAAIGTVFALSHSTPSTPPGTGMPGVTQK
ncbi:MAG TPA: hypothetical protein VKL99_15050 [Candidatus Angelobacter sp.]|nr:hypothetical protein [Candidatus Angelobacter sp.]